jgi:hypothetical protein
MERVGCGAMPISWTRRVALASRATPASHTRVTDRFKPVEYPRAPPAAARGRGVAAAPAVIQPADVTHRGSSDADFPDFLEKLSQDWR